MRIVVLLLFLMLTQLYARDEIPDNLDFIELDAAFLDRVNESFPERVSINPDFISNTINPTLHLQEDSEISVTFISEGAGYKNSFGYYTLDSNNQVTNRTEIFANASGTGPGLYGGGLLNPGDTYNMGIFPEDTRLGFYLIANGWNTPYWHKYYTDDFLNPDDIRHVATVYDPIKNRVVVGFEDLFNGGDNDFNDLIYSVQSTPVGAIGRSARESNIPNSAGIQHLGDSSGTVSMYVSMFGKISGLNDITLHPADIRDTTNVLFTGVGTFNLESNCGVTLVSEVSSLYLADNSIPTTFSLDDQGTSITTSPGVHNQSHSIRVNALIDNIAIAQEGSWQGEVVVTIYSY